MPTKRSHARPCKSFVSVAELTLVPTNGERRIEAVETDSDGADGRE